MDLREYIAQIALTYDRHDGPSGPAQLLLRDCPMHLEALVSPGMLLRGGRGTTNSPRVPWFAILDPDETTSPTYGLYVVYLFAADLRTVYLSLNQGCTQLRTGLAPV